VGKAVTWQYHLVWTPGTPASEAVVYRVSSEGHRFKWAMVALPAALGVVAVDQVLEELYAAVLALMEATA
jgi:hypothetical protein